MTQSALAQLKILRRQKRLQRVKQLRRRKLMNNKNNSNIIKIKGLTYVNGKATVGKGQYKFKGRSGFWKPPRGCGCGSQS